MKKNVYYDPPRHIYMWRRNLIKAKSIIIILLFACISASAAGFAQNAKVSLNVKNTPLSTVLQQLSMQSETDFIYSHKLIESKGNVSVNAVNKELTTVLAELLPGLGLEHSFDENVVMIKERQANVQQPASRQIIVNGIVLDTKGNPIVGATVLLKGNNTIGTATDASGKFSLTIPQQPNTTLVFSFVGKKSVEYNYTGQSEVKAILEDQTTEIEEVVITGIFNKPKESFTGAAVMVRKEELQSASGRGALEAIANLVPGFNILENNIAGSNPNVMPQVAIRGTTNVPSDLTGTQTDLASMAKANLPMIVMNGFEISIETMRDLDENQIESITILKDASAAAMYGTKGSNGVIVITTQKPPMGKIRVTYRGGLSVQAADLDSYNLMNSREKLEFEKLAGLYDNDNLKYDKALKDIYNQRLLDVAKGVDTYWIKFPVHNGIGHNHSLSVDGGEVNFRYGANVSYKNVEGTMRGNRRNTFNGNMFLQYEIADFTFSNDIYVTSTLGVESPYGTFSDYSALNQYFSPYDENGNMKKLLEKLNYYVSGWNPLTYNPLYNAALPYKNQTETFQIRNNFGIDWKVSQYLTIRGKLGIIKEKGRGDIYKSADHTDFANYTADDYDRKGTYEYTPNESFEFNGRLSANYFRTFNDKHMVFAGIEFNAEQSSYESYRIEAEGLSVLTMDFIGQAASYKYAGSPHGTESTSRAVGMTYSGSYIYDNRFTMEASGKVEGSSQFGKNSRFRSFWSVGTGWNLHNEEFIRNLNWVNYSRLRLSYGVTGDPVRRAYQALRTYSTSSGASYNGWYGVFIDSWGNPDLKMSTTYQFNIGTDLEFFNRRTRISFDVYDKLTKEMIMSIDIPTASGFKNYYANIGEVSNKGFDLSANFTPLLNPRDGLRLDVGFIMSHNKNKLKKISNSLQSLIDDMDTSDTSFPGLAFEEGKSINTIFTVKSKGIDPATGNEIFIKRDGTETLIWSNADRIASGTTDADIEGSINGSARYKGFNLTVFFRYRLGGQLYNSSLASKVENIRPYNNADRRALYDRWKSEGDIAKFKSLAIVSTTRWTSRFVMDNDIFQLSSISFGYDVPQAWSRQNLGVDYVSLKTTFNDLLYTSTIKRERGVESPFSRLFTFALTLRF